MDENVSITEDTLTELEALLCARKDADPKTSYAAQMHSLGLDSILRKLSEEVLETLFASRDLQADVSTRKQLVHEAADLLFHFVLLLAHLDVKLEEVLAELKLRRGRSGLAEKAARES